MTIQRVLRAAQRLVARHVALILVVGASSQVFSLPAHSASGPEPIETIQVDIQTARVEDGQRYWTSTHDNDVFAPSNSDRDYTGGFTISLSHGKDRPFSRPAFRTLDWLNSKNPILAESGSAHRLSSAVRFGLLVYTPNDLASPKPIHGDRPYASLLFSEFSSFEIDRSNTRLTHSSLSLGVIGSAAGEAAQTAIHEHRNLQVPRGFGNQISDGGEPTLRYTLGRYRLIAEGPRHDITLGMQASAGYRTDASIGINLRWGRRATRWWESLHSFWDTTSRRSPMTSDAFSRLSSDTYVSAGFGLRLNVYNVFLQGQFRHSPVTFGSSELNDLMREAWVGVTTTIRGIEVKYDLRYRSAEIRRGAGTRDLLWGGVTISKPMR